MSTENDERYTPEEESYDPEGIAELRRQEEEERLNRRIRREIIRIESGESDEAIEQERQRMAMSSLSAALRPIVSPMPLSMRSCARVRPTSSLMPAPAAARSTC